MCPFLNSKIPTSKFFTFSMDGSKSPMNHPRIIESSLNVFIKDSPNYDYALLILTSMIGLLIGILLYSKHCLAIISG